MKSKKIFKDIIENIVIIICSIFSVYAIKYVFNIPLIFSLLLCMLIGFFTLRCLRHSNIIYQIVSLILCGYISYHINNSSHLRYYVSNDMLYQTPWLDILFIMSSMSVFIFGLYAIMRNKIKKKWMIDFIIIVLSISFIIIAGLNVKSKLVEKTFSEINRIQTITNHNLDINYREEYVNLDRLARNYYYIFISRSNDMNFNLYVRQQIEDVSDILYDAKDMSDILNIYR